MTDLAKIKLARILTTSYFFLPIIIVYLQSRGFNLKQVFLISSIHSLCVVLFEYPTGVIADYFSPRTSVFLGYLLSAIVVFLMGFPLGFLSYTILMVLYSVSVTLMSGSDTVLISSVSKNFREDFSNINYSSQTWSVITIILGSLIAKYSFSLTFFLSALLYLLGAILVFLMSRNLHQREEGNIFNKAKEGLFIVARDKNIFYLTIIGLVTGGFFVSFKWLYNPLFEVLRIDLAFWGVLIALASVFIAIGMKFYPKIAKLGFIVPILISLGATLLTGITSFWLISLLGLFVLHFISGYLQTHTDFLINESAPKGHQASVLSFKNMVMRLFSSFYILVAGYIISGLGFSKLMVFTAIITTGLLAILAIKRKSIKLIL
ncbi:MFS transporter [Candidatus Parcubacteria bacterium]|nr:MFS transporter [Patescibacteria group bacterium]MBU4380860.1 MFS transporter [Patescibacteria group bacterium]MCG2688911.1 MFS transporter [Candidatus Parcubacteria bacterium]